MLEKLPSDIMVRMQEFYSFTIACAMEAAKLLRKLVFIDCAPLWKEIDCSNVKGEAGIQMLSNLIIQVRARKVTRSLSLEHCESIRGIGPAPLSGSKVLEKVDMR